MKSPAASAIRRALLSAGLAVSLFLLFLAHDAAAPSASAPGSGAQSGSDKMSSGLQSARPAAAIGGRRAHLAPTSGAGGRAAREYDASLARVRRQFRRDVHILQQPASREVESLGILLDREGNPLTAEQTRRIAKYVAALGPPSPPDLVAGDSDEQEQSRYEVWATAQRRSFYEFAHGVVTDRQRSTLADLQSGRITFRSQLAPAR
jgi:hypothetical protein